MDKETEEKIRVGVEEKLVREERIERMLNAISQSKSNIGSTAIWNSRPPLSAKIKLWWQRLWVRKDEFHQSLNYDSEIAMYMCECEKARYSRDLVKRRSVAHERDLK